MSPQKVRLVMDRCAACGAEKALAVLKFLPNKRRRGRVQDDRVGDGERGRKLRPVSRSDL